LVNLTIDFEYALVLEPTNSTVKGELESISSTKIADKTKKPLRKRIAIKDIDLDFPAAAEPPLNTKSPDQPNVFIPKSLVTELPESNVNTLFPVNSKENPDTPLPVPSKTNSTVQNLQNTLEKGPHSSASKLSNLKRAKIQNLFEFEREWKSFPADSLQLLQFVQVFKIDVGIHSRRVG
jgi:hypothetical protein